MFWLGDVHGAGCVDGHPEWRIESGGRHHFLGGGALPRPADTPILRGFLGEGEAGRKVYDALVCAIPMKRVGQPADIRHRHLPRLRRGRVITGQVVRVAGGLTMAG